MIHEILVVTGYIALILLVIAILAFFCFLIILKVEGEPEDTDGDIDTELIKDDDNQIFMNP